MITEEKLEAAIDFIEELSDKKYEAFLDGFESVQAPLFDYFNDRLEELEDEDQQSDSITIMMIIYKTLKDEYPELSTVSKDVIEECHTGHETLLKEIKEVSNTSELLDDEELSQSFIQNKSLHNFVIATLDPDEEDSPFDEESSDKAYHIIKICVDSIAKTI